MTTTKIKTITKYVVDGVEYKTLEDAERKVAVSDMKDRLSAAFNDYERHLDYDTCMNVIAEIDEVLLLFKYAGYKVEVL